MARTIFIHPGYRIRDLVACGVIVALGAAFVSAIQIREPGPALRGPAACFLAALVALCIVFGIGAFMDRVVSAHWPALVRQRRCPRLVLLGLPLIAIALALREPAAREVVGTASADVTAWATATWPAVQDFFASFGRMLT